MKKCKQLAILFVLLLSAGTTLAATENRVKALTGDGAKGAALVADSWTDPFYNSPSLALYSEESFFWVNDGFTLGLPDGYNVNFKHKAGLFYAKERFRLLSDFKFTTNFKYHHGYTSYEPNWVKKVVDEEKLQFNLDSNLLLAWELSEGLSFGFKLGIAVTPHDTERTSASSGSSSSTFTYHRFQAWDLVVRENLGVTFTREHFTTTLSLPFEFTYSQHFRYQELSGSKSYYKSDGYLIKGALRNITDLHINKRTDLRLRGDFFLQGAIFDEQRSPIPITTTDRGAESFNNRTLIGGGQISFTMNHYFKEERHHLFYGAQISTRNVLYGNFLAPSGPSRSSNDFNHLALDAHLGGEMKPHKKLHILFGLQVALLRLHNMTTHYYYNSSYALLKDELLEAGYMQSGTMADTFAVYSPMSIDISFGLEIYPVNGFTIELNSSLLKLSPSYRGQKFNFDLSFEIGFIWNISRMRKKRSEDHKEDQIAH